MGTTSHPAPTTAGHLAAIVESSEDAILSKDRNGIITSWNPAAVRLYGYSPEEAIGQPISILIPKTRVGEEREILDRILRGERVEHYLTERVRKDGNTVVVSLTASPIHDPDRDMIVGASVIARDITQQTRASKRAERLQVLNSELVKAVDPEDVIDVALREAVSALAADAGAVALLDEDGATVRVAGYSGYSSTSLDHWRKFSLTDELPMSEVMRTGEPVWPVGQQELVKRYPALAGEEIEFRSRAIVPVSIHGRIFGAISLSFREAHRFDPDERAFVMSIVHEAAYALERARLHGAERRARDNLDFLARAGELFAQSLDVETTLDRVAFFCVPRLADWCVVDLVEDGQIRSVAVAHSDPAKIELVRRLQERNPADPESEIGAPAVIRSGQPTLYKTIPAELLEQAARDEEELRALRELGLVSAMVVPLRAHAKTLGALTLAAAESGREFSSEDLEVAQDLARRAALAVENATLYGQEHGSAVALQRSLLPAQLPSLPGIQLAARYLPAGTGIDVGGDWYDTIELPNGRLHLIVGDVAGRGMAAASVMGQLRTALRAYVVDGYEPGEAVARLNDLARAFEKSEMATLVHLSLDPRTNEAECVRAGHTPPLIRRPDGEVEEVAVEGALPIGVQQGPCPTTKVRIEPGSLILLYTDGLVERRAEGIRPGLERLKQALRSAPADPDGSVDFVLDALALGDSEDDVAVLAARLDRLAGKPLRLTMPAVPSALARIRRFVQGWLADQRVDQDETWKIVSACNEACANGAEHAYAPSHAGTIAIDGVLEDSRVVLSVRDRGQWRPARGRDRGRGLILMRHFMDEVDIERSGEGTTVRMVRSLGEGSAA